MKRIYAIANGEELSCGLVVATAGVIDPPEDGGYDVQTFVGEGSYAKFVIQRGLLVGYILLNRPDNAGIYTAMIEQGVPLASLSEDVFEHAPRNLAFPKEARWERLHRCYPLDRDERGWKELA